MSAKREEKKVPDPAKQEVARLIDRWQNESDINRTTLAIRAGFQDYDGLYRAYFDMNRPLDTDPDYALGVIQGLSSRRAKEQQCYSLADAIRFFSLVQLPLDRYHDATLHSPYSAAEWYAAIGDVLQPTLEYAEQPAPAPTIEAVLRRIEALLEQQAQPQLSAAPIDHIAILLAGEIPALTPLPPISRISYARNAFFQGRDRDLLRLAALVAQTGPISSGRFVAVTGLGGVGKTNLVTEFVHRYGHAFTGGVFWLSAFDANTLRSEIAACGETGLINHPDWKSLSVEEQASQVRRAWQTIDRRLIILDNCEEQALLQELGLVAGNSNILVTSRRTWSPTQANGLVLSELERSASIALLTSYRKDIQENNAILDAIASELGDLPLALHLAGSFLNSYQNDPVHGDPAHFLHELQAIGIAHDALQGIDVGDTPTQHILHIAKSFRQSLDRLHPTDETDQLARLLLQRMGYIAPNTDCPRPMLAALIEPLQPTPSRMAGRAMVRLTQLGLLSETPQALRIHPLVAAFARTIVDPTQSEPVQQLVEQNMIPYFEQVYYEDDTVTCRLLMPHFHVLLTRSAHRTDDLAVQLCTVMPFLLDIVGDAEGAIQYLEHAHQILIQRNALHTPLGAEILNNLAEWLRLLHKSETALQYHTQALAIRRACLPALHSDLGQSCNNLGQNLRDLGRFSEAYPIAQEAYTTFLHAHGPTHHFTMGAQNNIGMLLHDLGDYEAACEQFYQLLRIAEPLLGSDDTRIAKSYRNLGKAQSALHNNEAGRKALENALRIFRLKLSEDHYETQSTLRLLEAFP